MDDREKLIELMTEIENQIILACPYTTDTFRIEEVAKYLIANGVTVQRWIPVTERLPEENKNVKFYMDGRLTFVSVLVCGGRRGVNIANRMRVNPVGIPYLDEYATNGWEWSAGNEDVTHWMPLPEPPKEDE